jgi:DNA-binding NarL/FixJ family response regulator
VILVANGDAAFCASVRLMLEDAGLRTLAAADGRRAIELARWKRPVVALLAVELPVLDGYQVCRELRRIRGWGIAIALIAATRAAPEDVSSGLMCGADDFLSRPVDEIELLARVQALRRRVGTSLAAPSPSRGLTARELEVLDLLTRGHDQRAIASALFISPKTVARHIEHILSKLGVHSRAEAVAAAYRRRLIPVASRGEQTPPMESAPRAGASRQRPTPLPK